MGRKLAGHKQWINCLSWCPLHEDPKCQFLASAGKDSTIKIWDTLQGVTVRTLSSHTASVTSIRWGGEGLLYSGSQDRTIKVWRTSDGVLCRTLSGHAHWINSLALNLDYVLRTGCFDPVINCTYPGDDKVNYSKLMVILYMNSRFKKWLLPDIKLLKRTPEETNFSFLALTILQCSYGNLQLKNSR